MKSTKDIMSRNDEGVSNGYWERYLDDVLWFKKFFINGISSGYEESYELKLKKPKEGEVLINIPLYINDSHVTLNFNL